MSARSERFDELDRLIADGKGDWRKPAQRSREQHEADLEYYADRMRGGLTRHTRRRHECARSALNLISVIAESYDVLREEVLAHSKRRQICQARHACYYALHKRMKLSSAEIADLFGTDHSTVLHGIRRHKERLAVIVPVSESPDETTLQRVDAILNSITQAVVELRVIIGSGK